MRLPRFARSPSLPNKPLIPSEILSLAAAFAAALTLSAQDLPREIYSGSWNSGHVQGAVVDDDLLRLQGVGPAAAAGAGVLRAVHNHRAAISL